MNDESGFPFERLSFLSTAGGGKTLVQHPKDEIVYYQGDAADAVFYIKTARSRSRSSLARARKRLSPY